MEKITCWLGMWIAVCFVSSVAASPDNLMVQRLEALAAKKQWQQLLHVRAIPLSSARESQNDSPSFFLAANGKQNPAAELIADFESFGLVDVAPDQSAQCRFPARYHWLRQQLPELVWQDQPCPEFEKWRDTLNARALTLIFPAAHINSPSSMYGHTLIRMDQQKGSSELLAYSVNFAANADPADNELVFSYKGLTGGYPGVVSVLPFAAKAREYRYMEYRDVLEYQLNLTSEEVAQFVRHVWELQNTWFDYYFFDENCSYRVLAMLDAASERSDTADAFLWRTIPVDTVRVLYQEGLIESTRYLPSASSQMHNMSRQALPGVVETAYRLVEGEDDIETLLQSLAGTQESQQSGLAQSQALELAHQYARYLAIRKKKASPVLRARTLAILSARSRRTPGIAFVEPSPPIRDDQGHASQRLQVATGRSRLPHAAENWFDLEYRPAFHETLDPQAGFVEGAQIQMGKIRLRAMQGEQIRLQELQLVDILSLSERDLFFRPMSWGVSTGLQRPGLSAGLIPFLDIRFGYTWRLTGEQRASGIRFWGLLNSQIMADNSLADGYRLATGPELGLVWASSQWLGQVSALWQPALSGENTLRRHIQAQLRWSDSSDWQLGITLERQLWNGTESRFPAETRIQTQLSWYF
jgi:hypothetical protein